MHDDLWLVVMIVCFLCQVRRCIWGEWEATITLDTYQVHTYNRNLQNNNESLSLSNEAAASGKEHNMLYLTLSIVLAPVSATSVAKRLLPDLKVSRRLFSPLIVSVGLQQSFINNGRYVGCCCYWRLCWLCYLFVLLFVDDHVAPK